MEIGVLFICSPPPPTSKDKIERENFVKEIGVLTDGLPPTLLIHAGTKTSVINTGFE